MDGAVNVPELFDVLNNKVEPLILAQKAAAEANTTGTYTPPPGWKRPFVETTTAEPHTIPSSETKVVEFMEEDESMGETMSVWLGPAPTNFLDNLALDVVGTYLTHSATSPLQKEFIEIPEPLSTYIGFYTDGRVNHNELMLTASDVPKKHLETFPDLVKAKLKKIVTEEGIDMERMNSVIRREKRAMLNRTETSVSSVLSDVVIQDFLYGNFDGKDLPEAFDDLRDFATVSKWTAKDWANLIDKYLVSAPSVTTIGKPSAKLSQEIETTEKERVAKQKAELGEAGLKRLQEELDAAKKESDTPIPPEILTSFPVTNPAEIIWIPVETAINKAPGDKIVTDKGDVQRHIDADGATVPFQAHFSHVKSNFVTISVLLDAANLPSHLMPYMAILQPSLFSLGVRRADGTVLSHEEVVNQLNDFTVDQDSNFSYRRCFAENFTVSIKAEKENYAQAVSWLRDVLTGSIFTKERLEVIIAKELQNLPAQKRDGDTIVRSWINKLAFDASRSPSESCAVLSLLDFIPKVAEELKEDPDKVIKTLEELRAACTWIIHLWDRC